MATRKSLGAAGILVGAAGITAVLFTTLTNGEPGTSNPRTQPIVDRLPEWIDSMRSVAVSLPAANQVGLFQPSLAEWRLLERLDEIKVKGPAGTLPMDGDLLVVGSGSATVARISLKTGDQVALGVLDGVPTPPPPGVYREPRLVANDIVTDGTDLYVTADTYPQLKGVVFQLDSKSLEVVKQFAVPQGQTDAAVDSQGRLWLTAGAEVKSKAPFTVSIREPERGTLQTHEVASYPRGMGLAADDSAVISFYSRDSVIRIDSDGQVLARGDTPPGPWGIAATPDKEVLVVSEGAPGKWGSMSWLSVDTLEMKHSIRLLDCPLPRDVVVVDRAAVVTCVGLPGLGVIDLDSRTLVTTVQVAPRLEDIPLSEEPRGLSVLVPAS